MPAKHRPVVTPPPLAEIRPPPADLPTGATNTEPLENPTAAGEREGIRQIAHRVMGSRQSGRKIERSGSRRQPKRGHGSQRRPEA
jgi:hypothetical protein